MEEVDWRHVVARIKKLHPDGSPVRAGILHPDVDLLGAEIEKRDEELTELKSHIAEEAERVGKLARGSKPKVNHRT